MKRRTQSLSAQLGAHIVIKVLRKGDRVLAIERDRIVIQRKSGEADVIFLTLDSSGLPRIDTSRSCRVGFGSGSIEVVVPTTGRRGSRGSVKVATY